MLFRSSAPQQPSPLYAPLILQRMAHLLQKAIIVAQLMAHMCGSAEGVLQRRLTPQTGPRDAVPVLQATLGARGSTQQGMPFLVGGQLRPSVQKQP